MAEVITFEDFTPPPRFDTIPWEDARIEEGETEEGPWTVIDTIALSPVDPDPTDPASRNFTTSNGTALDLWYQIVFVDGNGGESQPTVPLQNTQGVPGIDDTPYATVSELARILKIRTPTPAQELALARVLSAAALEINAELDRAEPFGDPPPDLVVEVNLKRAEEHWREEENQFGLVPIGETSSGFIAADTWKRWAHQLAPLKEKWGIG